MTEWSGKTVLMMAGGTGGHVYPALAVAQALATRGAEIHWLGNADGFEAAKVAQAGFTLHDIQVKALRGKGLIGWLKAPFMIYTALKRVKAVMRRLRPAVVIGMGGFVSGPGGLAAKQLRIPLVIHEQNAVMGMTNTWLAKWTDKVLLADKRAADKLPVGKDFVETGNPVRTDIAALEAPEKRYAQHYGKIRLLVLGGSQGAKALNELLPQALALIPEDSRPRVTHQVGSKWLEATEALYGQSGVKAKVLPFIEDMAQAYAEADWVLARSGAATVAEIATVGIAAVFVPFPHAVDDHQSANAQTLAALGAAEIVQQSNLDAQTLAALIQARDLREELAAQAALARQVSHAQALDKILHNIEEVLR